MTANHLHVSRYKIEVSGSTVTVHSVEHGPFQKTCPTAREAKALAKRVWLTGVVWREGWQPVSA